MTRKDGYGMMTSYVLYYVNVSGQVADVQLFQAVLAT